jgi:hypothetical protein
VIPPVAGHANHTQEIVSPTADEPDVKRLLCPWQPVIIGATKNRPYAVSGPFSLRAKVLVPVVPVTEEEVVVSKRPVAKEEVRVKKDVVEDTEVVEEDVRREEIDVEDDTSSRRPGV